MSAAISMRIPVQAYVANIFIYIEEPLVLKQGVSSGVPMTPNYFS